MREDPAAGGQPCRWLAAWAAAAVIAAPGAAIGGTSEDCLACHADTSIAMQRKGRTVSLHVDPSFLAGSAHGGLECGDCHAGFDAGSLPHKDRITPVDCMSCHADAPETHWFHTSMSRAVRAGTGPSTSCTACHGTHGVARVKGPDSRFRGPRQVEACGRCHQEVAGQFARSEHGRALESGEAGAPACLTCHEKPITPERAKGSPADLKIVQEKLCLSCHLEDPEVRAKMAPDAGFIAAYETSVHGAALMSGDASAPTCIDCHGSHEMKHGMDPEARISKARVPETCAACHADIAEQYKGSAHGKAVRRGSLDAPVCTDCHGEHTILLHTDPNSPVAAGNVSAQVCSPCHSSVRLSQKYGFASDRFKTFSDSYHGLAIRGGSVEAANCASCHGAHDIRPSSDPGSTVNKANLAATCGKCHPGANESFAIGSVHLQMTPQQEPLLYWIATIYVVVIVVTVGGMFLHNLLDFLRKAVRRRRIVRGEVEQERVGHALYLRMTLGERLQHGALMLSFTLLVLTGFMLSYPEAWWVAAIRRAVPDVFELRSLLHRAAGVVMTVASLVHVGYIALTVRGRRLFLDLLPGWGDLRDSLATVKYNLGLSQRRPLFGRFSYMEKVEYWALVWGTIMMVVTGTIMWFDNTFIGLLTKLGWDVARTVHFYEAWLATLAILVWHIYLVIFNPDAYPMNMAWLTGRLTEAQMAEEHPLELAALRSEEKDAEPRP